MPAADYPQDEFDRLADDVDVAVGVHRAKSRWWTRAVAAFGIFVLTGAATYGYFFAKANADEISWLGWLAESEPVVTPTPSVTWTPIVTAEPTPTASPSPSVSEDPLDIRLKSQVVVYNKTKINGLAGKAKAAILAEAEFKNVTTGDWEGAKPPANVIRYNSEKLRDTVDLLAEILGIKTVALGLTEVGAIEIVLVTDPLPEPSPTATP